MGVKGRFPCCALLFVPLFCVSPPVRRIQIPAPMAASAHSWNGRRDTVPRRGNKARLCLRGQKSSAFLPRYPPRVCVHPHYDVTWAGSLAAPPCGSSTSHRGGSLSAHWFRPAPARRPAKVVRCLFLPYSAPSTEARWAKSQPPLIGRPDPAGD